MPRNYVHHSSLTPEQLEALRKDKADRHLERGRERSRLRREAEQARIAREADEFVAEGTITGGFTAFLRSPERFMAEQVVRERATKALGGRTRAA